MHGNSLAHPGPPPPAVLGCWLGDLDILDVADAAALSQGEAVFGEAPPGDDVEVDDDKRRTRSVR